MLKGIDVSKWQTVGSYGDSVGKGHTDFMIVKATEGRTGTDPKFKEHVDYARKHNMLIGAYHYARPENNSAEQEAQHFYEVVNSLNLIGEAILVLDYEGTALKYGEVWAKAFLDKLKELSGVKAIIYLSESQIKNYSSIANADYGLWVANWSKEPTTVKPWSVKALWQLRGEPLDLDYFYGDIATWKLYAKTDQKGAVTENKEEQCHCKVCDYLRDYFRKESNNG